VDYGLVKIIQDIKIHFLEKKNGRWSGGITNLYFALRNGLTKWKQDSMKFCNYKCIISGNNFDEIHHVIPFREIADEAFCLVNLDVREKIEDYSNNELNLIYNKINELHSFYGYGACLNKSVHKLFHDIYGYTDFDIDDFIDFVDKILCGDFNDWFNANNLRININFDYIEYIKSINDYLKSEDIDI